MSAATELLGDRDEEELDVEGDELDVEGDEPEVTLSTSKAECLLDFAEELRAALEGGDLGGELPPEEGLEPDEGLGLDEEDEEGLTEGIMALLQRADIEVVDDVALKENMIKKVTARVARRILKEYL